MRGEQAAQVIVQVLVRRVRVKNSGFSPGLRLRLAMEGDIALRQPGGERQGLLVWTLDAVRRGGKHLYASPSPHVHPAPWVDVAKVAEEREY
eukprot:CAMPEP_0167794818 /NCGR_PEP_ID=MMETSP0111_2-20121227/14030_1 /TAXON_ID=91324 /ORGANISM="Lotharella globosa, Strain CCCM811" /LENGTH=91 /DNA_ID=CAMNT_0007688295 /DNA_START=469 /DNA_END=744 /DNA_ORIENTATION=-